MFSNDFPAGERDMYSERGKRAPGREGGPRGETRWSPSPEPGSTS